MAKVITTEVKVVSKVVVELDLEEAQGLHELLWRGVAGRALDELTLRSLAHKLHDHPQLLGRYRMFTESAQI